MKDDYTNRGFRTLSVDSLDEYRSTGLFLEHEGTSAQIYAVQNEDSENLFSYAFRTPPSDHTGVAHILEHAVLCGSERYPLKDPFLVLLKSSAHTFLNAMTYPDKTMYPAASTVKADFLNLLRVYGDAVFFPLIKKEVFRQEGHRVEFDDEGRLVRAGIVLNEMKGSYSSAESVAGDWTLRSLFPDTPYGWDSGGDPEHIPSLTYDAFRDFHKRWYHPSNARIFLYGDHDPDEVLRVLDGEFLSRFSKRDVNSAIPLQSRWNSPRSLEVPRPSAPGESGDAKSTISVNWMLGESTHPRSVLAAQVLSFILLGHSGAPLQKTIIDSGLGEDLSPVSGLETDLRQMVFSAAVRGTQPDKAEAFEELVLGTLSDLAQKGIDQDLVEGAFRSVEFRAREIRGGSPFGMRLVKRAMKGWLHDRPPMESLVFDNPMKELRQAAVPGYFESLIRENLVENMHRATVTVYPDSSLQTRLDEEERHSLNESTRVLNQGGSVEGRDKTALEAELNALDEFQETPDSPEDLARIPFLSRDQLPGEVRKLELEQGRDGSLQWFRHEAFANGVGYLEMAFALDGLDSALHGWLPLFGRALTDVGLPGRGHDEVARELAMKTGGLGCSLEASPIHPNAGGGLRQTLFVHLKALVSQWDEALELVFSLLKQADFSDRDRIRDLLLELRNDYKSAVVPSGHAFAALRASTRHSQSAPWEDLWYGVEQLTFLQKASEADDAVDEACRALKAIQDSLIRRNNLSLMVTGDSDISESLLEPVLGQVRKLPDGAAVESGEPVLFRHPTRGEALAAVSAVSFSALSIRAPVLGTAGHARSGLLAHILRTGFLWEHIRMKGGAYGASASISSLEGTFTFSTYRDPQITSSLETFRSALEWAASELDDETVNQAVIGAVGKELRPLSPGERGAIAFKRVLYGIDDELRQTRRDFQLSANADDLRVQAAELLKEWENRSVTVIAGAEALDTACGTSPELSESRVILPS